MFKFQERKLDGEEAFASELWTNVIMFALADRYFMEDLKAKALRGFKDFLDDIYLINNKYSTVCQIIP